MQTLSFLPEPGQVVHVRMRRWLVEQTEPRGPDDDATLVKLACLDDDAQGDTYNRFHDPGESLPAITQLRVLHAAMDRAVLADYGWHDLVPTHECLLDYEEDEDDDDYPGRTRKRKSPGATAGPTSSATRC